MMDARAAKLALARQKLKDHQVKKTLGPSHADNCSGDAPQDVQENQPTPTNSDAGDHLNSGTLPFDYTSIRVIEPEGPPKSEVVPEVLHETHPASQSYQTTMTNTPFQQSQINHNQFEQNHDNINYTEMLISSKRSLESQVNELQAKLTQLESSQTVVMNENYYCKQQIQSLQQELFNIQQRYSRAAEEIQAKDASILELNKSKSSLAVENNNLQEQLEFTKTILTAKESENATLQNQMSTLQRQLDVTQLHLQQISNGNQINIQQQKDTEDSEMLLQKISSLEQQLKALQKERDQINVHYEHYVGDLNEQLRSMAVKNEQLNEEVNRLSNRENSLIEQIGDMEIRLQNLQIIAKKELENKDKAKLYDDFKELQYNYTSVQASYEQLKQKYEDLQRRYSESEAKVKELNQALEEPSQVPECNHDNISLSKLNADITSDKIAAQRATEQNKKLKTDLQELEEAFVKISTDKLELTEKVAAEKFLNRELTIKLAEIEERAKDMHTKLMAKDEEMIRLQSNYRDLERKYLKLTQCMHHEHKNGDAAAEHGVEAINNCDHDSTSDSHHGHDEHKHQRHSEDGQHGHDSHDHQSHIYDSHDHHSLEHDDHDHSHDDHDHSHHGHQCSVQQKEENASRIQKEDAMVKLQERFLKIMGDVADLSDEKHRLEHIILQLQNETDTICEYVALYQQQRSLLKKRDEERSAQIKLFQAECQQLKRQLEELTGIIIRIASDPELMAYFQTEPRKSDVAKVMNLLATLKRSTLVDPCRSTSELKNFYPCSCCSGQLIDV